MKKFMLGIVMALLLSGPVAAECIYHGVAYSEGARICMHRTMYMCRGERWVKTAERCWEQYFTGAASSRGRISSFGLTERAGIPRSDNLAKHEQEKPEAQ